MVATSALVSGAEITIGVVGNRRRCGKLLHFSLPGALGTLRRDEDPLSQERIESFVGSMEQLFKIHSEKSGQRMVAVFESCKLQKSTSRFLGCAGRRVRGTNAPEKSRPAPLGMTYWSLGT